MRSAKAFSSIALIAMAFLLVRCTKDSALPTSATEQTLTRTPWSVAYYFHNQDMTNTFSSSKLLFSSTGAVGYQKNGETVPGSWTRTVDAANHESINLAFITSDPDIQQLNRSWSLVDHTSTSFQFEEKDGGNDILFRLKTD